MTDVPNDTVQDWTTTRERVKAWAVSDDAPRSAAGIACETLVDLDETRNILASLVADGVVVRVERGGVVRFGPNRERMREEAEEMLADAGVRDLRKSRDRLVKRLHNVDNEVGKRLAVYWLRIIDIALLTAEAGDSA